MIVVASAPSGRVMILVGSLQELVPRAGGLRVAAGRMDIETSRVRRVSAAIIRNEIRMMVYRRLIGTPHGVWISSSAAAAGALRRA